MHQFENQGQVLYHYTCDISTVDRMWQTPAITVQ